MNPLRNALMLAALIAACAAQPASAATERVPCKSTEATISSSGQYVGVRCPTTGATLSEGQNVHFQGDFRDAVARGGKLVWLDGPVGAVAGGTDPRVAVLEARLAKLRADLHALANAP